STLLGHPSLLWRPLHASSFLQFVILPPRVPAVTRCITIDAPSVPMGKPRWVPRPLAVVRADIRSPRERERSRGSRHHSIADEQADGDLGRPEGTWSFFSWPLLEEAPAVWCSASGAGSCPPPSVLRGRHRKGAGPPPSSLPAERARARTEH